MSISYTKFPKELLKRKKNRERQKLPSNIFAGNEDSIPDKIIIYYSEDNKIDIEYIDKTIIFKFKKLKDNIRSYKEELKNKYSQLQKISIISEREDLKNKITKQEEFINDLNNDISINEYKKTTSKLLDTYKKNFDLSIVEEYLIICSKYITLEMIKKIKHKCICKGCNNELDNLIQESEGIFLCPECYCVNNIPNLNKYSKDLEHYNNFLEEDTNNFIKVLDKFEGKNISKLPDDLFYKLDEYFVSKFMERGEIYRKKPLLKNGKKDGTSKRKLWVALESLNYNNLYDETSFITHVYWGWKLPDLTLYRDQIIKDYQMTQNIWLKIKKNYKRSASLGTQYRLYVHLLAAGFPNCDKEDFKIQDMVESLRLHNNAWEIMCKETGVKFYPVSF